MKKLLTIAALAGVASLSYGQGYVGMNNSSTTKISLGASAIPAGQGGSYIFEVLQAPTNVTTITTSITADLAAGWVDTGNYGTNNQTAGRIVAGSNTPEGNGIQVNASAQVTSDYAVVAFSAALGTFAQAVQWWNNGAANGTTADANTTAYFGISAVATGDGQGIASLPSGSTYNDIWGTLAAGQIPGMSLTQYQVPEPASFALAGLGAAALVIFRRRK